MKSLLALFVTLFTVSTVHASVEDNLYRCEGQGVSLNIVWDYFGEGLDETVQGLFEGKKFSFVADPEFNVAKVDPQYENKYFKDPKSNTMVIMVEPDLATVDDPYRTGVIQIGGKEIAITCEAP